MARGSICSQRTNSSHSTKLASPLTFLEGKSSFKTSITTLAHVDDLITFVCILHCPSKALFLVDFYSGSAGCSLSCCGSSCSLPHVARQPAVRGGVRRDVSTQQCKQKQARGSSFSPTTMQSRATRTRHYLCFYFFIFYFFLLYNKNMYM